MVHTAEFYVKLNEIEVERIRHVIKLQNKRAIKRECATIILKHKYINQELRWIIHIHVDFILMLNKEIINENDVYMINNTMKKILGEFITGRDFRLILARIDYRFDVRIESEEERVLILKLISKSKDKICYMKKIKRYKVTSIKYKSQGSRSNIIYDKNKEREAKKKEIKNYEANIIRFEAQIKTAHINYNYKEYGIERTLDEYLSHDKFLKYMDKMIVGVVGRGNFYNKYHASKIIKKSYYKEKTKDELIKFMIHISEKRSMQKTLEKYKRYKFEKYINILKTLDINPVLLPEKSRVTSLTNPLNELIYQIDNVKQ